MDSKVVKDLGEAMDDYMRSGTRIPRSDMAVRTTREVASHRARRRERTAGSVSPRMV